MRVDKHRKHALSLVRFDEAHPAHVGREVVDDVNVANGLTAVLEHRQVELMRLDTLGNLIPAVEGFDVHTSDLNPTLTEGPGEMTADEAAASRDEGCFMLAHPGTSGQVRNLHLSVSFHC